MKTVSKEELNIKCGITEAQIEEVISLAIIEAKEKAQINWLKKFREGKDVELEHCRLKYLEERHKETKHRIDIFSLEGYYSWRIATDKEELRNLIQKIRMELFLGGKIRMQKDIHPSSEATLADQIKFAIRPMLENYHVLKGIERMIWEEQHKTTLLGIEKFDESTLATSETLSTTYANDWDFRVINNAYGAYKNIPVPEEVLLFIEKKHNNYPWAFYIKGFVEEYERPIDVNLSTDEMKRWTVRHIDIKHGKINEIPTPIFTDKIENYGAEIAKAFKAWEFIVKNFPVYEKLYSTDCTQKPQYIINGSTIETLRTTLLNNAWPKETETKLESIEVWKTRFINSEEEINKFFKEKLRTGTKGSQFTDTRIFIKAMLDVILEKAENRPTNKDNYSKAKWGITLSKASKGKKYNDFKARIEAICGNTTLTK